MMISPFNVEGVRVSTDDLEKERGAVMEEYRGNRNANGRMQDAHWVLMMEGSKFSGGLLEWALLRSSRVYTLPVFRASAKLLQLLFILCLAYLYWALAHPIWDIIFRHIVQQFEYSNIGATELILSNGMRVCYKYTDFFDDQVLFTGFSYGGLSELPENEYFSCSMGSTIAGEIGVFGYRPSVLMDMLLDVEPREEDIKIVMQMAEEVVRAQERDPYTAFASRVRELNYGNSYFFSQLELGGIPRPLEPVFHFSRDDLKGLPFTFPSTIITEVVCSPMVEAQCSVQLCFPVELKKENMVFGFILFFYIQFVGFFSKLLETKIRQVLRFKHGQIYSAGISVFLGGNKPSRVDNVDLALEEILCLQEEGPTDEDVLTILEIEQRAHENGLQENYYWLDRILRSYQSRIYFGDVGTSFELALRRILNFPCKKQYTVVILMPQRSCFKKLGLLIRSAPNRYSRDAKILAGMAGLTVLVLNLWRYSRRIYIPSSLRKYWSTLKKKAPNAIKEIRKFAQKAMGTKDVRVDVNTSGAEASEVSQGGLEFALLAREMMMKMQKKSSTLLLLLLKSHWKG
ncbi:Zinc protease PQQL-like [Camellia lanceoleosa]|uniref:Zinc protease PQQL-like n=1 Tax=Camellia lanceoleosa TaxID=1840588 RepID=A0ACC0FHL1_9ERIC|nr:Zinc protease PQQL-like [Camellia lanceoleosa]